VLTHAITVFIDADGLGEFDEEFKLELKFPSTRPDSDTVEHFK